MEIKSVVNEVKNEYPKMKQINKRYLENNIPSKWLKIGLSSLGISMIMKNNVFAVSPADLITVNLAGGEPVLISIPVPIQICNIACPIVQIASIITFIITGLSILITKMNSKKHNETKKIKKWIKVTFIISIILFISSPIVRFFIDNIYY